MDYTRQPVAALLRGPLLRTPQGNVVLLFTACYLIAAVLVGLFGFAPWAGWTSGKFVAVCLAWPLILFLYFVRDNQPSFLPSWSSATWLSLCGAAPPLYMLFRGWGA
jgi:hypothetical protein